MLTFKHTDVEISGGHPSGSDYPRGQSCPAVVPQKRLQTCCISIFSDPEAAHTPSDREQSQFCRVAVKTAFSVCNTTGKGLGSTEA